MRPHGSSRTRPSTCACRTISTRRSESSRRIPARLWKPTRASTLEADARAFSALLGHLKEIDGDRHTVIMLQVENEPGSLGSVRDFSEEANRIFAGPPPAALVEALH